MQRIAMTTRPGARLFIDGGQPLRELPIPGANPADSNVATFSEPNSVVGGD